MDSDLKLLCSLELTENPTQTEHWTHTGPETECSSVIIPEDLSPVLAPKILAWGGRGRLGDLATDPSSF